MKVVLFCGGGRYAASRLRRERPETHGDGWLPADHVAPDEVLRPLRPQGLHSGPGPQGKRDQTVPGSPNPDSSLLSTALPPATLTQRNPLLATEPHGASITPTCRPVAAAQHRRRITVPCFEQPADLSGTGPAARTRAAVQRLQRPRIASQHACMRPLGTAEARSQWWYLAHKTRTEPARCTAREP